MIGHHLAAFYLTMPTGLLVEVSATWRWNESGGQACQDSFEVDTAPYEDGAGQMLQHTGTAGR